MLKAFAAVVLAMAWMTEARASGTENLVCRTYASEHLKIPRNCPQVRTTGQVVCKGNDCRPETEEIPNWRDCYNIYITVCEPRDAAGGK
jgi:hypothetical protein